MIKHFPVEFVYQLFALIFAAILVHGVYVSVVRPNAEAQLAEQRALVAQQPDAEVKSSVYVILKDYEQEACFVLMLWAGCAPLREAARGAQTGVAQSTAAARGVSVAHAIRNHEQRAGRGLCQQCGVHE